MNGSPGSSNFNQASGANPRNGVANLGNGNSGNGNGVANLGNGNSGNSGLAGPTPGLQRISFGKK